jgi:hypothetical protein
MTEASANGYDYVERRGARDGQCQGERDRPAVHSCVRREIELDVRTDRDVRSHALKAGWSSKYRPGLPAEGGAIMTSTVKKHAQRGGVLLCRARNIDRSCNP